MFSGCLSLCACVSTYVRALTDEFTYWLAVDIQFKKNATLFRVIIYVCLCFQSFNDEIVTKDRKVEDLKRSANAAAEARKVLQN